MVEVLVSILIVALGILGTLGLLMNGLRMSSSSNYRSIAAAQANAMADALRGNPLLIVSFDSPAASSKPNCFLTGGCSGSDFLNNNVAVWREQLDRSLPPNIAGGSPLNAGQMSGICRSNAANSANAMPACNGLGGYIVYVCWNEQRIDASSTNLDAAGTLCTWTAI